MIHRLLILFIAASVSFAQDYCCLCNNCYPRVRGDWFVDADGSTCDSLALYMVDPTNDATPGSPECARLQDKYRRTCCDATYDPPIVIQRPTQAPVNPYAPGTEPVCDLCIDGSVPKKPHTITAVLYINGNPTCMDLYHLGLAGRIENRLCYPLQDYMVDPCGCPPTSPGSPVPAPSSKPIVQPTDKPIRVPTRAPVRPPSRSPVRPPTKPPTRAPVQPPTKKPTRSPTRAPVHPPTKEPTRVPTRVPIQPPTRRPMKRVEPTLRPTSSPTKVPMRKEIPVSDKMSLKLPLDYDRARGSTP